MSAPPKQLQNARAELRDSVTVLLLAFSFGVVFLARNALGYLSPFVVADLNLANQSIGLLTSAYSLAWAVSGFAITAFTPRLTQRALLTGLALILARLASGLVSGPALPLVQSYAAPLGSSARRGLRMGIVQGGGATLFGGVLAPVILIPIALHWGWRAAFLPVAAMAIVSALLLLRALPSFAAQSEQGTPENIDGQRRWPRMPSRVVLANRNILLCSFIGTAMIGWLIVSLTFFPLYFVTVQHRSPAEMSTLMSLMGVGSLIAAFLVPHLADRFGRRRIMIVAALFGILGPLGMLLPHGSLPLLTTCVVLGSLAGGTFPLFMAVIPSETVSARELPAVIGFVQAISEIAGGVVLPIVAGWAADRFGLAAPLVITLVCALGAALFAGALNVARSPAKE
jgi:ACS family hexuronate transporter-like MFS transporter